MGKSQIASVLTFDIGLVVEAWILYPLLFNLWNRNYVDILKIPDLDELLHSDYLEYGELLKSNPKDG